MRRGFAVLTAILCGGAVACDRPLMEVTGQLPFLPVATETGARMLTTSAGSLELEDGCIWLRNGPDRLLVVWPPGYEVQRLADQLVILNELDEVKARVGDQVTLEGGAWRRTELPGEDVDLNVERIIGRPIPEACRIGAYWLGAVLDSGGQGSAIAAGSRSRQIHRIFTSPADTPYR